MCFGNEIGFNFNQALPEDLLFTPDPGALIVEVPQERLGGSTIRRLSEIGAVLLGHPSSVPLFTHGNSALTMEEALAVWEAPLAEVFPLTTEAAPEPTGERTDHVDEKMQAVCPTLTAPPTSEPLKAATVIEGKPTVFMPIFPGTNCEYDAAAAFRRAGAKVRFFVVRNLTPEAVEASIEGMAVALAEAQILMIPGGFSAGDEPEGSAKFTAAMFRAPRLTEAVRRLLNQQDGLILGICNGFQTLIKLGLLPYGDIVDATPDAPTLTFNTIGRHVSLYADTRVVSNRSPWLAQTRPGDIYTLPLSNGEGRFVANAEALQKLCEGDQIATQYVDLDGKATLQIPGNPNGSIWAIEGITSPDGRIFGKMAHAERYAPGLAQNIRGNQNQPIFDAGVAYFKL
jgi:phosphoribosylformylglycinamidine synthase